MPDDENTTQNSTPEENPSPTSPQEPTEQAPEITPVSEPSTMSSEAPEAPRNGDNAIPVNNDNEAKNEPESISPESAEAQEMPENQASPEPRTSQTAQIPANEPLRSKARELLISARNAIQFRKRKKLDRVMSLFLQHSKITNDEVEKFLHVSDATATRYLSILEREGKIKHSGRTGKGVSYSRI